MGKRLRRFLSMQLIQFLLVTCAASAAAEPVAPCTGARGESLRVLWTVSGYLLGKEFKGNEQEVKAYLFQPLDITSTAINFNGRVCNNVHFDTETVAAAEYLWKRWQVLPEELGITDRTVQVVRTNCDIPFFSEYLRLKGSRLVCYSNGAFIYFEPAVYR